MVNLTCGIGSLQACALRVTRLLSTGAIDAGNMTGTYISDAFIEFSFTPDLAEGDEFEQKAATGIVCKKATFPDQLTGLDVSLTLCDTDAEVLEILGAVPAIIDTGGMAPDTIGAVFGGGSTGTCGSGTTSPVALEVWTKAWACNAQDGTNPYIRWTFPFTEWTLAADAFTVTNDFAFITVNGVARPNQLWPATGRTDDVSVGDYSDQLGGYELDTACPTAACGYSATP